MTLSPQHDPMGQAVLDYLQNGQAESIAVHSTIFDNDEIPVSHLFRTFTEMPPLERAALIYARGRVLDVGAGAGCHALALQTQGHEVVSIDVSPGCVAAMRQRGLQQVQLADFFTDDFGKDYDTISVITDACDLSYIYEDEDGFLDLTGVEGYYGEVDYRMSYGAMEGEPFNWLYIDRETLVSEAARHGYSVEVLREDADSTAYLARITKN